ncbi:MAG: branched-chain amino acid ABC transporter permease [Actinobacteria bacterium]|nr:MAG: branched-chain amino acid ABC transporter permease [Actinomycetota bacterium]
MTRRWTSPALQGLVLAAAVVLIALLPRFTSEFRLGQFTYVAIYFVALLGLNILTGYNGQISLGHAAFMGIGGYTAAVLILGRKRFELLGQHPSQAIPDHGMRAVFTIPIAGLVAGAIGYLFGIPALRLGGVSLALATLAVAVSFPAVAKRFEHLTGGGGGLSLPLPHAPFGWHISTPHWLYYEAWVSAGILFVVAWLLVRGRVGRAGVAGALFAIQVSYINPDTFPVTLSILLLASVVIGGLSSLSGVIVGALVLEFLPIYAQAPPLLHLHFAKQAGPVVFGIALMAIVLLIPGGAASLIRWIARPVTGALARRG